MKRKNIAIVAPLANAYSETFIQAHRNKLKGTISFYYDGAPPKKMAGKGYLKSNLFNELRYRFISLYKGDESILFKKRFKQSLKKEHIDLVLAEYGTTAIEILPICKNLSLPMIVHFHGADATLYSIVEKHQKDYLEVFEYAKYIIAVSTVMEKKLLQLGAPRDKLILNTYGPNEIFKALQPTYESKKFIGIGRFVDKKAPYYLVLAFAKAFEKHPDSQLLLAGNGQLLNSTRNLVSYLNLEDNVKFLDVITPQEYKNHLSTARAFVQHSITSDDGDMEGTPLAILEASSAGLPVISTNHAGIPDVIVNEETGLLVDEHDVKGMAEYMIRLLEDKDLAKSMGMKGKLRIEEHFTLKRHIDKLDELIEISL